MSDAADQPDEAHVIIGDRAVTPDDVLEHFDAIFASYLARARALFPGVAEADLRQVAVSVGVQRLVAVSWRQGFDPESIAGAFSAVGTAIAAFSFHANLPVEVVEQLLTVTLDACRKSRVALESGQPERRDYQ